METRKKKNCREIDIRFKSYYVVWKRSLPESRPNMRSLFKSYYVVWKPDDIASTDSVVPSLNRTMQYGNKNKNGNEKNR